LNWTQPPNPIAALLEAKRSSGVPILDLTESNPTRVGLSYPAGRILAALAREEALRYDPSARGLAPAREAVAAYYRQRGANVDSSGVLLTASTSEAYSYLFQLLCDPGDEVLTPRPSYPLFEFLAGLACVAVRQYPLRYDGVWHIDFAALESAIADRTRAVVVVNPNNPTGSFLKRDELERLEDLAARRGLAIISDEVFCDYVFGAAADRVITLAGERRALTFSLSGLSKIAGLPQMKLGWIAASGPGAGEALHALELIADTYLSVGTPVQAALPDLLASSHTVRDAIRARMAANRARLDQALAGFAATVLPAEGGWYAVAQIPRTRSEEQWVLELLDKHNVLVQPGFFFDFESEAFLVLSLLPEPAVFDEGVRRLRAIL
jgi:alanine-synthesizing transaminase